MTKSENFRIYSIHHENEDYPPYENNIVTPIQGGWADAKVHKNMQGDELGPDGKPTDNISKKAYWFSEFTVNYWIWKNTNHEVAGIMHYRRALFLNVDYPLQQTGNFCTDHGLTEKRFEGIFQNCDAVVGTPENFGYTTIAQQHRNCHALSNEFFAEAKAIITQKYPRMLSTFESHFYSYNEPAYFKCQIVAKKDLFNEYMQFVFDVLFGIEKKFQSRVEAQPDKGFRLYAFMGERLMSLFVKYKMNCGAKIKVVPIAFYEDKVKKLTDYQPTLVKYSNEYDKKNIEPEGSCRFLFYHENLNNSSDKRVSLNINYVAHNKKEMSAIYRKGQFWFYNRDRYNVDPIPGDELDYFNHKGEKCWIKFDKKRLYSRTGSGTYEPVENIAYRTWNDEGCYKTNLIIWNEPDDKYKQEDVAKQDIFVFRNLRQQVYFSASAWFYCVNRGTRELIKISKRASEPHRMQLCIWPRIKLGLPVNRTDDSIMMNGVDTSYIYTLRMDNKRFSLNGTIYPSSIPYMDWDDAVENVAVATWYTFYAKMP